MGVLGTDTLKNSEKTSLADISSESLEKSAGARLRWTLKNIEESFSFSGNNDYEEKHVERCFGYLLLCNK